MGEPTRRPFDGDLGQFPGGERGGHAGDAAGGEEPAVDVGGQAAQLVGRAVVGTDERTLTSRLPEAHKLHGCSLHPPDQTSDVYRSQVWRPSRDSVAAQSAGKLIGSVPVQCSFEHGVSPLTAGIAQVIASLLGVRDPRRHMTTTAERTAPSRRTQLKFVLDPGRPLGVRAAVDRHVPARAAADGERPPRGGHDGPAHAQRVHRRPGPGPAGARAAVGRARTPSPAAGRAGAVRRGVGAVRGEPGRVAAGRGAGRAVPRGGRRHRDRARHRARPVLRHGDDEVLLDVDAGQRAGPDPGAADRRAAAELDVLARGVRGADGVRRAAAGGGRVRLARSRPAFAISGAARPGDADLRAAGAGPERSPGTRWRPGCCSRRCSPTSRGRRSRCRACTGSARRRTAWCSA